MAHPRPGEHDAEQEQHDDGADVDEDLDTDDALGGEEHVGAAHAGEDGNQVQRGVHDVRRRDQQDPRENGRGGEHPERDVLSDHYLGTFFAFT